MPRRIPVKTKAAILAELQDGRLTQDTIAKRYGVSASTIRVLQHRAWFGNDDAGCKLTMEQLDAMIAERLPTMPGHDPVKPSGPRLPQAVSRGRGLQASYSRRQLP